MPSQMIVRGEPIVRLLVADGDEIDGAQTAADHSPSRTA